MRVGRAGRAAFGQQRQHRADLTEDVAVAPPDQPGDGAVGRQRIEPGGRVEDHRQQGPERDAGEGDDVRDDLMVQVDAGDRDEGGQEEERRAEIERRPESPSGQREQDRREKLDRRIAP